MVLRLFGVLPTIEGVLTNDETDPFLRPLTIVQAWSMVLYYPLDNVYWLALHEVIPMSEETRDAASRVSCQAWGLYIVLDIAAYVYNMRKLMDEQKLLKATLKHIKAQASVIALCIFYQSMQTHPSFFRADTQAPATAPRPSPTSRPRSPALTTSSAICGCARSPALPTSPSPSTGQ